MAVIFSALGITLLLSAVIVNALEVHEDNQKEHPEIYGNGNSRLNVIGVCQVNPRKTCLLYCNAGAFADISKSLNYHWEENPSCQSKGVSVEVSSTVYFPTFTIPANWLNGNFKLKELRIDVENIFEISQNAFSGAVFEWMQKLVLFNLHLRSMESAIVQELFAEQHFKHLTITKNLSPELVASVSVELYVDSILYLESNADYRHPHPKHSDEPIPTTWLGNMSGAFMISLTIVGCMLSFSLGLFIRCSLFGRKVNKMSKNRTIFVIENRKTCLRESVNEQKM